MFSYVVAFSHVLSHIVFLVSVVFSWSAVVCAVWDCPGGASKCEDVCFSALSRSLMSCRISCSLFLWCSVHPPTCIMGETCMLFEFPSSSLAYVTMAIVEKCAVRSLKTARRASHSSAWHSGHSDSSSTICTMWSCNSFNFWSWMSLSQGRALWHP